MKILQDLLAHHGVVAAKPASPEAIAAVAQLFDCDLPRELLTLWRTANGVAIDAIDTRLLGCEEVADLLREASAGSPFVDLGLMPLVSDNQSNYCALALREPLAHRVLFLPHDDGPNLFFANLDSCLRAVLGCVESGESFELLLHESAGDYAPEARRCELDQQAARVLMATNGANNEWNFAAQLLDETNLDEFARLLETDHFVRRDVLTRMNAMQSPEIRRLLGRDREAFAQFSADLTGAAKAAGLGVENTRTEHVLRIGGIHIELEVFFHERHRPESMPKTIARIQELIALKARRR
jgi:hypothetical protein